MNRRPVSCFYEENSKFIQKCFHNKEATNYPLKSTLVAFIIGISPALHTAATLYAFEEDRQMWINGFYLYTLFNEGKTHLANIKLVYHVALSNKRNIYIR